ncbi:MAG: phosphodiester glycosidase family protein [Clostridia bacterium]|nr:phosphodiester glycosidase family protein [Clostridia bacterium]MBR1686269.1 phosphodiester glycosidase family protein [Clostridia bacterium]
MSRRLTFLLLTLVLIGLCLPAAASSLFTIHTRAPKATETATVTPTPTPTPTPSPSPSPENTQVSDNSGVNVITLTTQEPEPTPTLVPWATPTPYVHIVGGPADPTLAPLPERETVDVLPIDFSPGKKPLEEGYIGEWEYEDPTIHVKIEQGRENETTYYICEVRIADASQLRTASADGFDSNMVMPGTQIAKRMNAVVAIDGDYFFYTEAGYILRQGKLYLDKLRGGRDVLLIDEDGDFHILRKAKRGEGVSEINGKKVINAFFFGPVLVENGELGKEFRYTDMAYTYNSQRMAICQIGKLHYKIICCESPHRGSKGMLLEEFARFCQSKGVQTAYNLDGGDSTMLFFRNEKINDVDNPNARPLADILYFASAYSGE